GAVVKQLRLGAEAGAGGDRGKARRRHRARPEFRPPGPVRQKRLRDRRRPVPARERPFGHMKNAVDLAAKLPALAAQGAKRGGIGRPGTLGRGAPAVERAAAEEAVEVAVELVAHSAGRGPCHAKMETIIRY